MTWISGIWPRRASARALTAVEPMGATTVSTPAITRAAALRTARTLQPVRPRACRDDNSIRVQGQDRFGARFGAETDLEQPFFRLPPVELGDTRPVPAQRRSRTDPDLPTDPPLALQHRHRMA